jgi:PAS domain S-box-containing protein
MKADAGAPPTAPASPDAVEEERSRARSRARDAARAAETSGAGARMTRLAAVAEELAGVGSFELDLQTRRLEWSDGLFRVFGFAPGQVEPSLELLLELVHPQDRARVRQALRTVLASPARVPGEGLEIAYRVQRRDGSLRAVRGHERLEGDRQGRPRWSVGAVQDITEQDLSERQLQVHDAVSRTIREWTSFEEGVRALLRRLGTALGADVGSVWGWDAERGVLACTAFWHRPDVDGSALEHEARTLTWAPGEGSVGTAWVLREPALDAGVVPDPAADALRLPVGLGVGSGVAIPLVGDAGPLAVLAYANIRPVLPSDGLLATLSGIGHELGRFLGPWRAERARRRLSAREVEIIQLAADGLTGPAIAARLVISHTTVRTHFRNIYDKLDVGDRAAAVARALRTGVIR